MTYRQADLHARHRRDGIAAIILLAYLLLGILYSVASPLFEAADEQNHYPFAQHLATGGGLPVQRAGQATLWAQEGSQPPLYYAAGALLTAWLPTGDLPDLLYRNPHDRRGVAGTPDNANMYIHTDREAFPWHGTALAVHLLRLFSVLLGAGTVLCTYLIARRLFPDRPAIPLTAMALNAFIPMFLFISASVDNDNLVVFLASVALLMLVRVVQSGASRKFLLAVGVVTGLAALSKLSALGLLPLACLALLLRRDRPSWRPFLRAAPRWIGECLIVVVPAVLIAGWWYMRNWQLYGDPTGMNAMLTVAGGRTAPGSLHELFLEFQGFLYSFWGVLGGFTVLMHPTWIYTILDLSILLALIGLAAWAWRIRRNRAPAPWRELILLAAWIGIEAAALLRWTSTTLASQGRLMFAAISAICLFLALGFLGWLPPARQRYAGWAVSGLLLVLAVSTPFTSILPAYAAAPVLTEADVPASSTRFDVDFGDVIRLLAYDLPEGPVKPGSEVPVTLYWTVLKTTSEDLSIAVHLFGWHQELAQVDTYPGGGTRPTSRLQPGQVLADHYVLRVPQDARGPAPVWITAGVYRLNTMEPLPATDANGKPVVFAILAKRTLDTPAPTLAGAHPVAANLGNRVRLTGYDLAPDTIRAGQPITPTLYWQSVAPLDRDLSVFIHLRDKDNRTVAQADGPPLANFYPTSAWQPGEILNDSHQVDLPADLAPGRYLLVAGLVDPQTGERLPVEDGAGQDSGNEVKIAELQVVAP